MEWVIKNYAGLFNDIYFIFYKDIYVHLLALAGYVCPAVIGVFRWDRLVCN